MVFSDQGFCHMGACDSDESDWSGEADGKAGEDRDEEEGFEFEFSGPDSQAFCLRGSQREGGVFPAVLQYERENDKEGDKEDQDFGVVDFLQGTEFPEEDILVLGVVGKILDECLEGLEEKKKGNAQKGHGMGRHLLYGSEEIDEKGNHHAEDKCHQGHKEVIKSKKNGDACSEGGSGSDSQSIRRGKWIVQYGLHDTSACTKR